MRRRASWRSPWSILCFIALVLVHAYGNLEKSAIKRIRSQAWADAEKSLNCCILLQLQHFEVPLSSLEGISKIGLSYVNISIET